MMKKILKWFLVMGGCLVVLWFCNINIQAAEYRISTNDSWVNGSTEGKESNFYIFTLPSAGKVTVTHQSYKGGGQCYLLDKDLVKKYGGVGSSYDDDTSDTKPNTKQFSLNLEAGTYQLELYGYTWLNLTSTKYRVKISFVPVNNNEKEPNNTFETAMKLSSGTLVKGFLSEDDLIDFYTFSLGSGMTIRTTVNTSMGNYSFSVWNSDLIQVDSYNSYGSQTKVWEKYLAPGKYYIKINRDRSDTGTYTLKWTGFQYISAVNLKKSTLSLVKGKSYSLLQSITPVNATDKNLKWTSSNTDVANIDSKGIVTAKKIGMATIKAATMDGSNLEASCLVVVTPVKTVIKSCKRAKDRNIVLKVKKQKDVSGIQYQLCKKKNFKGKKSSYYAGSAETKATTAILAKNTTYYFRVRMYVYCDGKRYYGAWSKVKRIKTKGNSTAYGYYSWKDV